MVGVLVRAASDVLTGHGTDTLRVVATRRAKAGKIVYIAREPRRLDTLHYPWITGSEPRRVYVK